MKRTTDAVVPFVTGAQVRWHIAVKPWIAHCVLRREDHRVIGLLKGCERASKRIHLGRLAVAREVPFDRIIRWTHIRVIHDELLVLRLFARLASQRASRFAPESVADPITAGSAS